jgi:diguanylate cyclase (GGDEF)-like protein
VLIEQHEFRFEGKSFNASVSLGIATTPGGEEGLSPPDLIRRADACMYQAKREGRNRVVLA